MKFPLSIPLIFFILILATTAKDPFTEFVAYEAKQRKMAGVNESQYHLLPFRLAGEQQDFLMTPTMDEMIYTEVVVHWIGSNSSLNFPSFDLSQKIRIIIQEENFSTTPFKNILTKQFLTQTGFKLNITAGKRYRWKIESNGK